MSTDGNGNGVTYTVKELLAKLDGKLDGIIVTIGQKADKHDVESLGGRVKKIESALSEIDVARSTAVQVAATLAAKTDAERSWWERQRNKFAWGTGVLVAIGTLHSSFPHVHP